MNYWIRVLFVLDLGNGGKCIGYVGYKGWVCSGNFWCLSGKCVCKMFFVWNGKKCVLILKCVFFIYFILMLVLVGVIFVNI